ncbi:DEKNAAC103848 [Brettanomyces naardenensis]|uniref:NAD(+) diphosphatase n=1 Tax=Brettanomyces naardenensis TaxID=13370 RepID=A0A448YPE5_BRENA|nr:DEKNAAC103848 [Brettanomyces naardenensis]
MSTFFGAKTSLNRFSFLRTNSEFIKSVVEFPSTRLILFKKESARSDYRVLGRRTDTFTRLSYLLIGDDPKVHLLLRQWADMNARLSPDLRLKTKIAVVFLGLDEDPHAQDSPLVDEPSYTKQKLSFEDHSGVPLLAVDITENTELLESLLTKSRGSDFLATIDDVLGMQPIDASIFSYAKMYIDWLARNQFCPGCGSRVIPVCGGTKLQCTNEAKEVNNENEYQCPVRKTRTNNVCFPRTDPVVILALRNSRGDKILLGHNARRKMLNKRFFSCFSGFMEPGETIESAAVRETWEETGLKIKRKIQIVKSQPWPFPCCLMVGCVGITEEGSEESINIHLDKELDVCEWFDVDFVADLVYGRVTDGDIMLPNAGSVAFELIKIVVDDCLSARGRL